MHVHYIMTCLKLLLHPCPAREGSAPIGEQYWQCVRCLSLSLALSQQFIDPGCTDQETLCVKHPGGSRNLPETFQEGAICIYKHTYTHI